jgi:hypothetical protein
VLPRTFTPYNNNLLVIDIVAILLVSAFLHVLYSSHLSIDSSP